MLNILKPCLLYKYKGANDNDIKALLNDYLYIPTLDQFNDPNELSFSVSCAHMTDYIRFHEYYKSKIGCLSFSTKNNNRYLWNYYTDGMKGMVLEYNINIFSVLLSNKKCDYVLKRNRIGDYNVIEHKAFIASKVIYDGLRSDLTVPFNKYLENNNINIGDIDYNVCLTKDPSWSFEDEYRIIIRDEKVLKQKRLYIKPQSICVGYKMEKDKLNIIVDYCERNGVNLFIAIPKFYDKTSNVIDILEYNKAYKGWV